MSCQSRSRYGDIALVSPAAIGWVTMPELANFEDKFLHPHHGGGATVRCTG